MVFQNFAIRTVFRSGPTLCSIPLPMEKQSNVIFKVPCTCSKAYIGGTKHRLETHLNEHKDMCIKCLTDKSVIAECSWTNDHPINWATVNILQRAYWTMELVMKEVLIIRTTPKNAHSNWDSGYELPNCWIATYGGANLSSIHCTHVFEQGTQSGMQTIETNRHTHRCLICK